MFYALGMTVPLKFTVIFGIQLRLEAAVGCFDAAYSCRLSVNEGVRTHSVHLGRGARL